MCGSVGEECCREVVGEDFGEEGWEKCCREVLEKRVVEMRGREAREKTVAEKCWRRVLYRSVGEECWDQWCKKMSDDVWYKSSPV